jgi:hypothetical protein
MKLSTVSFCDPVLLDLGVGDDLKNRGSDIAVWVAPSDEEYLIAHRPADVSSVARG